jgi:hypothetical protein
MFNDEDTAPFQIDPEFQSLIPPLSEKEREDLSTNLLDQGCREPLVVWSQEKLLLDGHNRFAICQQYGLNYTIKEITLGDRQEAIDWIIKNQLGRRNLTSAHISYFRGKLYNSTKTQGMRSDLTCGQNDQMFTTNKSVDTPERSPETTCGQNDQMFTTNKSVDTPERSPETTCGQNDQMFTKAQKMARDYKVGEKTIRRDGEYAKALDLLAQTLGNDVRSDFLRKDTAITRKMILELAGIAAENPENARRVLKNLREGQVPLKIARHLQLHRGSLVEIKSQKPEIADKLAKVVAVNEVTVDVLLRNTQTMEMVKHRLRLEEVEPVALDKEPRVKALSQRLSQLQALVSEPFERELIDLLGQRVALTPVEEDYLTKMEQKYFYFA